MKLVSSPNQTTHGQSIYDVWDKHIDTMGSGSDFTAFQDFAGIPCTDMGFGSRLGPKDAVYHYHSNYDSFDWMQRFGDPSFEYHATIAKVWALVVAKLVETPVLQLNATDYAIGIEKYIDSVKRKAKDVAYEDEDIFDALDKAASRFRFASSIHDATAAQLLDAYYNNDIPWWKPWEKVKLYLAIRTVNTKYKFLERKFLYPDGLDGRPWFKHVVFAPGKWTGYAGATFPGIVEGLEEGGKEGKEAVVKWVSIVAAAIEAAADWLESEG